jgi:hypothetical protein
MDPASKRLEFLRQAATMPERSEGTARAGWLRSDRVAAALGWSVADRATYFGGAATDLVATDLGPQSLIQLDLRLTNPRLVGYNYIFGVTPARVALARGLAPPAAEGRGAGSPSG